MYLNNKRNKNSLNIVFVYNTLIDIRKYYYILIKYKVALFNCLFSFLLHLREFFGQKTSNKTEHKVKKLLYTSY